MFYNEFNIRNADTYPHACVLQYQNTSRDFDFCGASLRIIVTGSCGVSLTKACVELYATKHCCGALWLANLNSFSRGMGYAQKAIECAIHAAKQGGYSIIQCIIPGDPVRINPTVKHIFTKYGFKYLRGSKVRNSRTGNYLYTFQLEVK